MIVSGLLPSAVLQRTEILPGAVTCRTSLGKGSPKGSSELRSQGAHCSSPKRESFACHPIQRWRRWAKRKRRGRWKYSDWRCWMWKSRRGSWQSPVPSRPAANPRGPYRVHRRKSFRLEQKHRGCCSLFRRWRRARNSRRKGDCSTEQHGSSVGSDTDGDGGKWWRRRRY